MKSILVGNGVDIQFGGKAYSNRFIMSRIIYNARANKYDALFDNQVSGEDVERIFTAFLGYANDVLKGKYDHLHHTDLCNAICDFKSRFTGRNSFENYYDIPLEDWFMLLQIFFTNNPDLIDQQVASKQGFERIVLDAIFNEGRIQNIYKKIGKNVRKFFRSFDTIFTLCILRRRTDTGAFAGGHSAALADIDFFCLSGYFSFNNDIVVLRYPFKHGVG